MAKIRYGFVSNSSSSSFVIAIPNGMDTNLENILYTVFPETIKSGKDIDKKGFYYYDYDNMSALQAAEIIVRDLGNEKPNDIDKLKEALGGYIDKGSMSIELLEKIGLPPKYPERSWKLPIEESRVIWEEYSMKYTEWTERALSIFSEHNKGSDIYTLEYSDNEGSISSAMEHAGVFNEMIANGTAIVVSHH